MRMKHQLPQQITNWLDHMPINDDHGFLTMLLEQYAHVSGYRLVFERSPRPPNWAVKAFLVHVADESFASPTHPPQHEAVLTAAAALVQLWVEDDLRERLDRAMDELTRCVIDMDRKGDLTHE